VLYAHRYVLDNKTNDNIINNRCVVVEATRNGKQRVFRTNSSGIYRPAESISLPHSHALQDRQGRHRKTLREKAERERAEHRSKRLQLELRYEEYCRHEVERYLEEELGGNEYKILFAAKKQELALTYRNLIFNPASLTEMSHAGVRSEIMQRVKLQTFEKFCAGIGVRLFGEDI
jgi:hypothetical protein